MCPCLQAWPAQPPGSPHRSHTKRRWLESSPQEGHSPPAPSPSQAPMKVLFRREGQLLFRRESATACNAPPTGPVLCSCRDPRITCTSLQSRILLNMHRHKSWLQRAAPWKPERLSFSAVLPGGAILRIPIHKIACQAQIPGMSQARDIKRSICAGILPRIRTAILWDELLWLETSSDLGKPLLQVWVAGRLMWCFQSSYEVCGAHLSSQFTIMSLVPLQPENVAVVAPADWCETSSTFALRLDRRNTAKARQISA